MLQEYIKIQIKINEKVGIIGGSGYTGGELIRLVLAHPELDLDFVYSSTKSDIPLTNIHQDLLR